MPQRLTAKLIQGLKPKKNRFIITDDKAPGLALVTNPNGKQYFYYRYRPAGSKKVVEEPVGNAAILSVDDARKAVAIKAGDVAKGIDIKARRKVKAPKAEERKEAALQLFDYIDKYYEPYAKEHSVTVVAIIRTLKREFEFVKNKPINEINGHDIDSWRSRRCTQIKFSTIKRAYTYLKACINTAVKHYKLIDGFELQNYTLKRRMNEKVSAPKMRYLSREEEQRLLQVLAERDNQRREKRANYVRWQSQRLHRRQCKEVFAIGDFTDYITPIVIIAYQTGFDLGDIFDLDWQEHIDLPNNQILKIRNKTKHKQDNPQPIVMPLSVKVKEVLEQWGKQHGMNGRVFKSPVTGGRLDNITKAWKAIRIEAKLENFRFKDLRHSFGSWLAMEGVDLLDIRDLMGHTDIKTTQIYAHLCPKNKERGVMSTFS